jgi:hypothetical protein
MLASLVEFMENSSVDGFLLADALPAGQIHGRRPADSANGRRSKDVHCFQIIGPPMGIPAAVRPRDFGTSRSRLCAEPTPSLGAHRRGAALYQSLNHMVAFYRHAASATLVRVPTGQRAGLAPHCGAQPPILPPEIGDR